MIICTSSTRRAHLELMFIFQEFTRNKGQFQWNNLKDLKGIYLELIKKKLTNFFLFNAWIFTNRNKSGLKFTYVNKIFLIFSNLHFYHLPVPLSLISLLFLDILFIFDLFLVKLINLPNHPIFPYPRS